MFNMKVEKQMNIKDRTLLLGIPESASLPNFVHLDNEKYKVLGASLGVLPPFLSLEIERTTNDLTGKTITE